MLTDISSGNTVTNNLDLEEINSDITEELGEALALIYKLLFKS